MTVSDFKTSAWQSKERAEAYHASTVTAHNLFQIVRRELFLRYVQRYAPSNARILDLGCGTGLVAAALRDLGYRVVACDVSQAMLHRASETFGGRAIELLLSDAFHLPLRDGEFDMVISRMFIAHFPDWRSILREKARLTRLGGIVLFDFGNREHYLSAGQSEESDGTFPYGTDVASPESFYAVATEEEMRAAALECGLDVVAIVPHGFLLYNRSFWQSVGRKGVDEFNSRIDELLQHQKARDLLLLIEESFVPHLPKQTTYGSLVVLRRNASTLTTRKGL